jgi:hypothetical protein
MIVDEDYLGGTPTPRPVEAALPAWCTAFSNVTTRATVTL